MNKKERLWRSFLFMVETTGIEPVSKNPFIRPSPWAVYLLKFPFAAADKQAAPQGIPFLLDRFKREPPMQVHCSNDAQTKVAVILGGTGGYKETAALPNNKARRLSYLGSHSNCIVVVYFLIWPLYGVSRPATLIVCQNPCRNHYVPKDSEKLQR